MGSKLDGTKIVYFVCDIREYFFCLFKRDESQNIESFSEQFKQNVLLF
jgi:hypothetical protein